jgi:1,4-dihydroxy-2-naphthoyl-CoA synthase
MLTIGLRRLDLVPSLGTVADTVRYELDGHVATITYHRPDKLNVIDGQMRAELNAAFAEFRDDEEAWMAIVTGAGPGVLRWSGSAVCGRSHW